VDNENFDALFDAVREICDLPDELKYGFQVKTKDAVPLVG